MPVKKAKKPRKRFRVRRHPAAGLADVLGTGGERKITGKWRKHYQRLKKLRDALLRRQSHLSQAALEQQPNFSIHMADAGTDEYDRDFALGMLSSEQDALYQIEAALERIRTGSYGICELTGKRIEAARLEAIPWTRFSRAAEEKLEKEGVVRRARLGARETVAKGPGPEREEGEEDE